MSELDAVLRRQRLAAERALRIVADDLLGRAQRIAPKEEGTLEASGHTEPDIGVRRTRDGGEIVVAFAAPYAAVQHENLTYRHDEGRQAKYLEGPLKEMEPRYTAAIGAAVKRATPG